MLSDVAILAARRRSSVHDVRVNSSVAVVAVSQLLAAEAFAECRAEEQLAAEQASLAFTSAAVSSPGSRQTTA